MMQNAGKTPKHVTATHFYGQTLTFLGTNIAVMKSSIAFILYSGQLHARCNSCLLPQVTIDMYHACLPEASFTNDTNTA